ncbi:MAG: tRNA (N6-adenosine(37)-N6)-threonylcarbamoyltransferase complex ATPase TsaE [Rhizobiales bacterium NRL2]|nr:MAG: tRNA (N6-adenosine(37)-N6)-threonylcarbamoyltransferase complex ATPase TsaE [Rhizobiales bacterium NRL2]
MSVRRAKFHLPDPAATEAFGRRLARALRPGDVVLLSGDLGMGKTALARAVIQALAGRAIDAPSPTFNLVLPYDLPDFRLWHFDLYRLSGPGEVEELGFEEAAAEGVALVEWPDRLGDLAPPDAVRIAIETAGDGRRLTVEATSGFMERLHDA